MQQVTRHTGRGNSRFYTLEGDESGVRYPNVTSITGVLDKPALVGWAEGMGISGCAQYILDNNGTIPEDRDSLFEWLNGMREDVKGISRRKKEDAADVGTETHTIIERVLRGEIGVDIPDHLRQTINSFMEWYAYMGKVEVLFMELGVVSTKYSYGGTIDVVMKLPSKRIMVYDWKTSNGLYKETTLQLAAYRQAFIEMSGYHPNDVGCAAVRLGKDYPAFEYKDVNNPDECLTGFLACMQIRQWHDDMKGTEWQK